MTRHEWLRGAVSRLQGKSHSSRLDCEILLATATNTSRTQLLAQLNVPLEKKEQALADSYLERRLNYEPIAYITGVKEFYGRQFFVDRHVMIPRPESEPLVEAVLTRIKAEDTVYDVGTGSGAIAISIGLAQSNASVIATDISPDALKVAQKNAQYHNCEIQFQQKNIMEGVKTANIVVANLPYVPEAADITPPAAHEPALALFGGKDGLDYYRKLFLQLEAFQTRPRLVICEAEPRQATDFEAVALKSGYTLNTQDRFLYIFELLANN